MFQDVGFSWMAMNRPDIYQMLMKSIPQISLALRCRQFGTLYEFKPTTKKIAFDRIDLPCFYEQHFCVGLERYTGSLSVKYHENYIILVLDDATGREIEFKIILVYEI